MHMHLTQESEYVHKNAQGQLGQWHKWGKTTVKYSVRMNIQEKNPQEHFMIFFNDILKIHT